MSNRKASEVLFEAYLDANGFGGLWQYEKEHVGKSKKPDYVILWESDEIMLEVKEIEPVERQEGARKVDVYGPIRQQIKKAQNKFKEFKDRRCAVVVTDFGDTTMLEPYEVFGAMLGDLGISCEFDAVTKTAGKELSGCLFLGRGKMLKVMKHDQSLKPENTRISAVIILERLDRFTPEFYSAVKHACTCEEQKLGRPLKNVDRCRVGFAVIGAMPVELRKVTCPRVRVCRNPFTPRQQRFPDEVFRGQFDEHWEWQNGYINRTFAGPQADDPEDEHETRFDSGNEDL
ncbi:MAG: hypothetical protein IT449_16305 [Phycisphaerales bacterium]|nr:hypothetical protein [Phycisphaerales bacterium]